MTTARKQHKSFVTGLAVVFALCSTVFFTAPAFALPACTGAAGETPGTTCEASKTTTSTKNSVLNGVNKVDGGTTTGDDLPNLIKAVINTILFIAGSVAVLMIILGGIRYITSNGDQADVKAAKDTILYAVIGLIVAIMAFAIVQFVVSKL